MSEGAGPTEESPVADLAEPSTSAWSLVSAWGPSIAWAVLIFFLSTDSLSAAETRGWIVPAIRWLWPSATPGAIRILHAGVRKTAHASEYFVFGLLLARGFRLGSSLRGGRAALAALVLAGLYSLTDEGHQLLTASREPRLADCGIDTLGAALAVWLRGRETIRRPSRRP